MLVGGAGNGRQSNQKALLGSGLTRCLTELALGSNAPAVLKSQALNALADILRLSPPNQDFLTSLSVTPLIPPLLPSSVESYVGEGQEDEDGEEQIEEKQKPLDTKWRRGKSLSAVVAVVSLGVHGDGTPGREGLRVRAGAVNLFEVSQHFTAELMRC